MLLMLRLLRLPLLLLLLLLLLRRRLPRRRRRPLLARRRRVGAAAALGRGDVERRALPRGHLGVDRLDGRRLERRARRALRGLRVKRQPAERGAC
ncbi:MAG: hypothetical protein J3K34DRAFT_418638 [Monoraphidium minutum]|nr:MAG: hypothetical protein J3K34DRAFT_418638 [Monoraphidium minutum]